MALALTLACLLLVPNRLLVLVLLLVSWTVLFFPLSAGEIVLFVFAALFFLLQNYVTLQAGLFEFKFKDILLMPLYEPPLWGFYFLALKRFNSDRKHQAMPPLDWKSVLGVVVTSSMFSLFSNNSQALFVATICSTAFLFVLFHTRTDIAYALSALVLGLIIELFGVSVGLWWYPAPDLLGIPYWFATMWISVGLLGRRFLIPAAERIAARFTAQRA